VYNKDYNEGCCDICNDGRVLWCMCRHDDAYMYSMFVYVLDVMRVVECD